MGHGDKATRRRGDKDRQQAVDDRRQRRGSRPAVSPFFIAAYVILSLWALWALLPLFWMFSTSFKEIKAAITIPPEWFPRHPTLLNYQVLFARAPVFRWLLNSGIVAAAHTISMLLFCSMAGYAFAKKDFPGKNTMFWMLLSTMMIPSMVLLVPLFLLVSRMGLINNFGGLILPGIVGVFGVFLMKQFMQTLPNELLDAARIDGASELGVYSRVVLPLSKPALAVLGIFSFMGAWNDFLWPLLITQSKMMRTLAVGLATLQQESMTDYGLLMAGSAIAAIPMIIVFFAWQKHFLKGLTIGAIKG